MYVFNIKCDHSKEKKRHDFVNVKVFFFLCENHEYLGEKTGNLQSIVNLIEHLKRNKKQTFCRYEWNYLVNGHVILIENDQMLDVCVFLSHFFFWSKSMSRSNLASTLILFLIDFVFYCFILLILESTAFSNKRERCLVLVWEIKPIVKKKLIFKIFVNF